MIIINLEQYNNVYFTSDMHFGHTNILKFEPNRLSLIGNNVQSDIQKHISKIRLDRGLFDITDKQYKNIYNEVLDSYIKIHDDKLIQLWNSVVTDKDIVFILGDFSFYNSTDTEQILNKLNGDKVLIYGNHDKFIKSGIFNNKLFKDIQPYMELKYNKQHIALMHYPIMYFNHLHTDNPNVKTGIHLCGHIHSNPVKTPCYSYNVGVDVNNYVPVSIDVAIQKALSNSTGKLNNSF